MPAFVGHTTVVGEDGAAVDSQWLCFFSDVTVMWAQTSNGDNIDIAVQQGFEFILKMQQVEQ